MHNLIKVSSIVLLFFLSNSVFAAGGTITFTMPTPSTPTGIPTLSSTMLVILSLLLFVVASKVSKQKKSKITKIFMFLLGSGLIFSSYKEIRLISDTHAGAPTVDIVFMQGSNSAMYTVPDNGSLYFFANTFPEALSFTAQATGTSTCTTEIYPPGIGAPIINSNFETSFGEVPVDHEIFISCRGTNNIPN